VLAAGGVITAIDAVLDGKVDNVYALTRPPGHHAEADQGRGFCIFGNAAIGAMHARQARGLERVAIVDWDVHHGNGTQKAFYGDPTVLTVSIHQDNYYPPGEGMLEEVGEGAGEGYAINLPLPAGSGVGAYVAAFERVVAPALRSFRPDLIIVASGLDASVMDPLARMMMTSAGYKRLTQILMEVADEVCDGRLVVEHEGGYSSAYVPFCGLAVVEQLSGISSGVTDPFLEIFEGVGGQDLQPHQDEAIAAAEANLSRLAAV
jgi:acetoin utilization deacetylase AcuC-like enzyme